MKNITLITTEDGSHSLHLDDIGEGYHSTQGAITEALHVYINPNLAIKSQAKKNITIFEMGFGTGLNALLSLFYASTHSLNIQYYSTEAYPIDKSIYQQLNYPQIYTDNINATTWFIQMHKSDWNKPSQITPFFTLTKLLGDAIETFMKYDIHYDCCYYDAFAPQYQPNLWSESIFKRLYELANPHAILSTYCCKGDVKRALKSAQFDIEKLPGFGNKREMLRATKD